MKQLKFMLAAAAAFGIATAQADTQLVKTEISSENFDDPGIALTNSAAVLALDGFTYEGATASDNESYVVAGGANSTANALKVNTGTDPLLRKIYPAGAATGVPLDATKKVYIDTMVQFTVTPYGDTVSSNGVNDKLMIYLKEMTNVVDGVVTITGTNLMVKAAKYTAAANPKFPGQFAADDFVVDAGKVIVPGTWYHLVVKAFVDNGAGFSDAGTALFEIELDGVVVKASESLYSRETSVLGKDAKTLFPSLLGKASATLKQVGFAGEGMVDGLVFSKDEVQQTSVDFTFTGDNLSSVTYTIGEGEDTKEYTWTEGATVLDAEATITIKSIAFSDLYTVADNSEVQVGSELTVNKAGMKFPITAKALTGDDDVPSGTKPADIGIANATIPATVTVANTTLDNMIKWASANKGDKTAISFINDNMKFDDEGNPFVDEGTTNVAAQAFLLNCAVDQIETVKDAFKITSLTFDEDTGLPVLNVATAWKDGNDDVTFNGTSALEYKASLKSTDPWGAVPESMTEEQLKSGFFRARLILK